MKKGRFIAFMLSCLMLGTLVGCGETEKKPEQDTFPYYTLKTDKKTDGQNYTGNGVAFSSELWKTPTYERYEALDRGNIKAYFIDSVADTKVFCYVGIPEGASAENKVPAVVLVHGATGTAFYDWVELWVQRGYAAIAMDTEGRMPTVSSSLYNADYPYQTSIKAHGPINAAFGDSSKPIEQQWVYNAIASVIVSTSYLSGLECVDVDRIGITGVSYGGFLACLATAYDDRFVFSAPIYGCLSNAPSATEFGSYINNNIGAELWDDCEILNENRTPMLFVNSDTDRHFAVDSVTRCAAACKYGSITFIPGLSHGHSEGAEIAAVFTFADEICKKSAPLIRVTKQPKDGVMSIAIPKDITVKSVKLRYTLSETLNSETDWLSENADISKNEIFYSSESFKKHWYVNIEDSRGYIVSSVVY